MSEGAGESGYPDSIDVSSDQGGKRLDTLLRELLPGISRAWARGEIESGRVLIDGRRARKSAIVSAGSEIDLREFRDPGKQEITPDRENPPSVIFEDDRIVVVNKEEGLPTLPRDATETNALACRLAGKYPELASVGPPLEAGLLHRLDTGTSGILVAARTEEVYNALKSQWKWRRVEKEYLALIAGKVERAFTSLQPIAHHPKSAKRMVVSDRGKSAETLVRPIVSSRRFTLVRALLKEGRRHQIRVHLADAGFPVVGDELYGPPVKRRVSRIMLHAAVLRFRIDERDDELEFHSAPGDTFTRIVKRLVGDRGVQAIAGFTSPEERGA